MSDVIVMFSLGVGMYFAAKIGFSPAPLVLGLILGKLTEENFLQGRMIADSMDGSWAYFFSGTINLVVIAMCVLSIGFSIYSEMRDNRQRAQQAAAAQEGV